MPFSELFLWEWQNAWLLRSGSKLSHGARLVRTHLGGGFAALNLWCYVTSYLALITLLDIHTTTATLITTLQPKYTIWIWLRLPTQLDNSSPTGSNSSHCAYYLWSCRAGHIWVWILVLSGVVDQFWICLCKAVGLDSSFTIVIAHRTSTSAKFMVCLGSV